MIDTFLKILNTYSAIEKKPKDLGTGHLLFVREIHAIATIGKNPGINVTQLAETTGVTRGASSQIVKKLLTKHFITGHKSRNNKEINLSLSEIGEKIFQGHEAFEKEMFSFAVAMYDRAKPADRDLVKRLFLAIYENMKLTVEKF